MQIEAPAKAFASIRAPGLLYVYAFLLALCLNFMQTGGHDRQRVIELLILAFGGCLFAFRPPAIWNRVGPETTGATMVFFLCGILSGVLAFSPRNALFEVASFFLLMLCGLAIAEKLARERDSVARVLQVFGAVAALYALKVFCIYVSVWLLTAAPDPGDFSPGFSNIRHFNHVQTIALPMLVLVYLRTPGNSRLRYLWMTTLAIWWSVLFVTGGRGTGVGLIAAVGIVAIMRRGAAWPFLRAMIVSLLVGTVVYELAFVIVPVMAGRAPFGDAGAVLARTMADPSSGRAILWKCALGLIAAHPWLGVGPLHFAHERAGAAHPHDWMLQIGSEWGIPALLAFCLALTFALRGLWRTRTRIAATDTANQNMLSAWILIAAALLIDASVSGSIVMPQSQMMIGFYIACAAGWAWSLDPSPRPEKAGTMRSANRVLAIAAALTLAYSVAPQFVAKATDAEPTAEEIAVNGNADWWPRLWRGGYF
jgi:O-antigen ligase